MNFIVDPGLVLYLPLHELDGASIMSRDAYGHLCTVTGALWTPNGHYFDGTDDFINCSDMLTDTQGTIIAWIHTGSNITTGTSFLSQSKGTVATDMLRFNLITGLFRVASKIGGVDDVCSWGSPAVNTWYCLMVTSDGSTWRGFTNGVEETLSVVAGGNTGEWFGDQVGSTHLRIGGLRHSNSDAEDYEGTIGEIMVYSRPLSPAEGQNIYQATKWRYQ